MSGADDTKSALNDTVREWAEKNPDDAPPPAPGPTPNMRTGASSSAPGSTATPSSSSGSTTPPSSSAAAAEPDDDDQASDTALDMEEVAEFGVTAVDFAIQNFISPRCAFKPHQKAELSQIGAKVLDKWFPELAGAIEPEYAFVGAAALFAYGNYKASLSSSPGPAKQTASSASGGSPPSGSSGDPHTTSASVDGRDVKAEVLP